MTEPLQNWAGNYTFSAPRLHRPATLEQLQELVKGGRKLKILGARHSFNIIADSPEDLISLEHFNQIVALEPARHTVMVEGGVRYGPLCQYLNQRGFALHNLASLPHVSVAGAVATATHGSGDGNRNLATAVSALELVTAEGEIVSLSRAEQGEQFLGAVVNLGGLGAVTQLTLDILPTFEVQQVVYEALALSQLETHFEEVLSRAYSVSLFTDWRGAQFSEVWLKHKVVEGVEREFEPELFGATLATHHLHPIADLSAVNCTEQLGKRGPWHERLPHFRMEFTPSSGEELQSEYFVGRSNALAALRAVFALNERISPHLLISEVRTIAADNLWLSPCYHQASVSIHFTWKKDWPAVKQLLPVIEDALAPFNARPHWGKLFTMSPSRLQSLYARLPDFQQLLQHYDPRGKFRNVFLDTYLFGPP